MNDLLPGEAIEIGQSMLCWPVALSYQLRYQFERHTLRSNASYFAFGMNQTPVEQIRLITKLCKTDQNIGTSIPQGAKCLVDLFENARIPMTLKVVGLDAYWANQGLYPATVKTHQRRIEDKDIIEGIKEGRSIIAMLGFYSLSGSMWVRDAGHFVSITGYRLSEINNQLENLIIVNPAIQYDTESDAPKFDQVQIIKNTEFSTHLRDMSYQVSGHGVSFQNYKTGVESIIVFSAGRS